RCPSGTVRRRDRRGRSRPPRRCPLQPSQQTPRTRRPRPFRRLPPSQPVLLIPLTRLTDPSRSLRRVRALRSPDVLLALEPYSAPTGGRRAASEGRSTP